MEKACGNCGANDRVCLGECEWGEWGPCLGEGECAPGEAKTQSCGECAVQTSVCGENCLWNPWGQCLGTPPPCGEPEICGNGIDEDGDGLWDDVEPDMFEPNNSCAACLWISGIDPDLYFFPTFDSPHGGADPADYFCFEAADQADSGQSEQIVVELEDQPQFIDGDLYLYRGFDDCAAGDYLAASITIGGGDEFIQWSETAQDDSGVYYVRIENWSESGNCYQPYSLHIDGLK